MPRFIEPSTDDPDTEVVDRFDDEQATPILAAGTRDSLVEKAREAQRLAAQQQSPSAPGPASESAVGEEVALLAHDMKNPLTIIMLESMQIEQRLGLRITPAIQHGLERITQNASYIDRLVSDLLDASSVDEGKLELRLDRLDLSRLLRDAVGRAVPTAERTRLRLEIRDVLFVQGDEIRIERVVTNLVHNALEHGGRGGSVTVRLDARGAFACVSVIDSGPGLTVEESRAVFERFRKTPRGGYKGYGLGLYASRRIIEAHRGRIGVASQPGRGARFFFELPAIAPHHMNGL